MSAETEVFAALSGDAGVTALVAQRIYPDVLPEKSAYPAVVFARVRTEPTYGISGNYFGADVGLQVGCWGTTRTQADAVGSAVETALRLAGMPHVGRTAGYDEETDLFASVIELEIFETP